MPSLDTHAFEELFDVDTADLLSHLWRFVVAPNFKGSKQRERANDGIDKIFALYIKPFYDHVYHGKSLDSSDHYRTRAELIKACRSPKLIRIMTEDGFLELHPHWPNYQSDHLQAPYRQIFSRFVEFS